MRGQCEEEPLERTNGGDMLGVRIIRDIYTAISVKMEHQLKLNN